MTKMKRFFVVSMLALLPALLLGQGTGPTVYTPRLTVSPGPLTVTTDDTTVQDLIILGTCTGCVGTANFANPTATIGLTAVNGVAATGIRSDGAPALSQAIAPTWTNRHIFTSSAPQVQLSALAPRVCFDETDTTSTFMWDVANSNLRLFVNTADSCSTTGATNALNIAATGVTVDSIALTSTALTWNGNPISTAIGANPTASLGLTAVNGAATTFMRSDAAPALSQSIAPSWSALHSFTLSRTNATPSVLINSTVPGLRWDETDAAADNRLWELTASAEAFRIGSILNDAGTLQATAMQVDRTAGTIDSIAFTGTTVTVNGQNVCRADGTGCPSGFSGLANPSGTIGLTAVNGTATTALRSDGAPALSQAIAPTWTAQHTFSNTTGGGAVLLSSTTPLYGWQETDGAANNQRWRIGPTAETWRLEAVNDAISAANTAIAVDRTGTTIDSVAITATNATVNGSEICRANGTGCNTTGAANPTGTIGLTAVNGSATTFLRSDGAPPLSQAIAPTWTATHIWSGTGSHWTGTVPQFGLRETGATADEGNWLIRADGDQFLLHTATDAAPTSAASTAMAVSRSGTTPSGIDFLSSTVQLTNSGWLIGNSAAPRLTLNETDAAANNRLWRIGTSAETLVWGTRNDADSSGSDFFSVDRTGTTVDSVTLAATTVAVTGAATVSGSATISGNTAVNGGLTKAACSATVADGTVNNYDIFAACGSTEAIVRLNSAAGTVLTGMVLPSNQYVTVINVGTTNITFNDEDGGSTGTNQFVNIGSLATCTAGTSDMVVLWKDPTTDKVRVFPYVGVVCGA